MNPRTFFDFSINGGSPQRVIFELFKDIVPKTCENFRALCTGEKGMSKIAPDRPLSYKGSVVHRIVASFMIQGGDFISNNGKSGESIYGGEFEDENFDLECDQEGLLVMANKGPNTNNSQWFITLRPAEHLNGKHVVFGRVQSGLEVVREISNVSTDPKKHRPIVEDAAKIVHCGELELRKKQAGPSKAADDSQDGLGDRKTRGRSGSRSGSRSASDSESSSSRSESSGAARRRRRKAKREAKEAKRRRKAKRTKVKEAGASDVREEELALRRVEAEHEEARRREKEEKAGKRAEAEVKEKARALEALKSRRRSGEGQIIFKGG